MEGGDCILPAISVKRVQGQLASGGTVGGSFQECVAPDSLELSTRKGYQALWRTVLTWGIVHEVVGAHVGLHTPLGCAGAFRRFYKAVTAVKGTSSLIMFSISTHHVKRLLERVGLTECQERDVLVCVLETVQ